MKYLITQKANISAKDLYGKSPIHYAVKSDNLNVVKYVCSECNKDDTDRFNKTPLIYAALAGNIQIFQYFISSSVNFFAEDLLGKKVLHYSIRSEKCIELCLKYIGDINARDKFGNTILIIGK